MTKLAFSLKCNCFCHLTEFYTILLRSYKATPNRCSQSHFLVLLQNDLPWLCKAMALGLVTLPKVNINAQRFQQIQPYNINWCILTIDVIGLIPLIFG